MKLTLKLTAAFLAVVCVLLALHDGLRVRSEIADFEGGMDRDHELLGRALAHAAAAVLRSDGLPAARAVIATASQPEAGVQIRWVCLDGAIGTDAEVPCAELRQREPDAAFRVLESASQGPARRISYVVVPGDGFRGAIEVSEPVTLEREYIRLTVLHSLKTAAAVTVLCTALAFALGVWFVGRPTRRLVAKARAIGRGEFGQALSIPQRDEIGELANEMNLMCDRLHEAKRAKAEEAAARNAAVEQLRHADRLRTVGTLASGVAHEIGTPLNIIEARAGLIAEAVTDSALRRGTEVIIECCERITRIVRQLLVFARERKLERSMIDLCTLLAGVIELLRPLADERSIKLTSACDKPIPLEADALLLQQAITNLIMNAVQASEPGAGVEVRVATTQASPEEGGEMQNFARIDVIDEGAGIPKDDLNHVFEPFFTTKEIGEGTGLGLSVAYGIVREHGGFIDVRSEVGHGSTFSVYIPWKAAT